MITWAVRHELLERHPCTKVQKHRDQQRERALSEAEARRLWTMIGEAQAASVITSDFAQIIRLIMLTGARRNEIVELRWSEVDLDRARLVLPPVRTKMGALNRPRHIVLSEPVLAILHRVKRRGAHVLPSSADKPLTGVNRAWEKVRKLAGIEDVRLHDLRHSFAPSRMAPPSFKWAGRWVTRRPPPRSDTHTRRTRARAALLRTWRLDFCLTPERPEAVRHSRISLRCG